MKKDLRILMLEGQADDANLAQYALRDAGLEFLFHRVDIKEDFLQELERHPPDMIGVAGMRERVALLGGDFNICGRPGQGTTVTVRIAGGPKEKPHHE